MVKSFMLNDKQEKIIKNVRDFLIRIEGLYCTNLMLFDKETTDLNDEELFKIKSGEYVDKLEECFPKLFISPEQLQRLQFKKDLEFLRHELVCTNNLWATDRPDLIKTPLDLLFKLDLTDAINLIDGYLDLMED